MPVPQIKDSINRLTAKERIYQTLRDWIIEGVLSPNEKLNEAELAEHFSVSRTPVREAIQLLEVQKLVEIQPGKATIVTGIDIKKLREWYLPLAAIQGLAAEMACAKATPLDIKDLQKQNDAFASAMQNGTTREIQDADAAFHNRILEIAGNQYLTDFSETLFLHVQRIEHTYFQKQSESAGLVQAHQGIIDAIAGSDPTAAGERMKRNWLQTMALYEETLFTDETKSLS